MAYAWDANNRLQSVTDNRTNGTTSYTYDATNQLASFTYPNGVIHSYTYDLRDRISSLNVHTGTSVLASYTQTFSPSGRKLSAPESTGRTPTYSYDPIYRLLSESITGGSDNGLLSYSLDSVGNRLSLTSTLAELQTLRFTYDANDRISGDTFDANGNTITSNGVTHTYDFQDRLVGTSTGVQFVYDADGNRTAETAAGLTTTFLVDTQTPPGYPQVTEEVVNGSVTARFSSGLMRISQNQAAVSYYGYDASGSVRGLFDNAGAVTDIYAYDAFGNAVARNGSTLNEFQYRGEQFDSSVGMYYLRARYYRPQMGRFLTADKYEAGEASACDCLSTIRNIVQYHLYVYAGANPVSLIDRSGSSAEEESELLGFTTLRNWFEERRAARIMRCAAYYIVLIMRMQSPRDPNLVDLYKLLLEACRKAELN